MAPLSHFAVAALAVVGAAAAPLSTQPSSSTTLERRGFGDFMVNMLQFWAEKGPLESVGDGVSYKPDIANGLEKERQYREGKSGTSGK
jgi:hypothetical protein